MNSSENMEIQMDEEEVEAKTSNVEANNPMLAGEKEAEKLKGDAIGNTLYSESGLLKTLISLSKHHSTGDSWSEQLEEQLCFLWDMTFEEDVIAVLMEHDFVDLACQVIQATSEPRLTEILVGILGNMTAIRDVRQILSQSNSGRLLLTLLSSSDTPTLLQLVRLLNSCVWHISRSSYTPNGQDEDEHLDSEAEVEAWIELLKESAASLNEHLSFILKSSTNEELLQSTLELLNNLCCITSKNHYFSEFLSTPVMLQGLSEALHQLLDFGPESDEANFVWVEKAEKAAQHWSQTLSTFTLQEIGIDLIYEQRQTIMRSLCGVFDPLCLQENIFPLNSRKLEVLDSMMDVLECLKNKHNYCPPAILPRMLTVLSLLVPMNERNGDEPAGREDLESDEDKEKLAEVLKRISDYSMSALCDITTPDFLESFGENPVPKIKTLLSNLSKCSGSDTQKVVKIIERNLSQT